MRSCGLVLLLVLQLGSRVVLLLRWLVLCSRPVCLLLRWQLPSLLRGLCSMHLRRPLLLLICPLLGTWLLALLLMWISPTRLLLSSLLLVGCMRPLRRRLLDLQTGVLGPGGLSKQQNRRNPGLLLVLMGMWDRN